MGFGVYGKSNRNKRETGRNGVKFENTPRGMFMEDFVEKATGRCARNQMGFMTQTARGRWDMYAGRKNRSIAGGKIPRRRGHAFPGE